MGEEVGHELVVVGDGLGGEVVGVLGTGEADEFDGGDAALVQQLEEAVLAVGAWLPEVYYCCLVTYLLAATVYALSVALHVQLLDVRSEFT